MNHDIHHKKSKKYICYVAGKSGGHIIPALTDAQKFLHERPDYNVLFFSTNGQLDCSIIQKYPWIFKHIPLSLDNVPKTNFFAWPIFMVQLIKTFCYIFFVLCRHRPEKIITTGGYISIPVCCVGFLLRIPFEQYSLDVVPGQAIKFLSPLATKIHLCFEKSTRYLPAWIARKKSIFTPYPLRYQESDKLTKEEACIRLGIDPKKKVLCVLGGSQGSHFINQLMITCSRELLGSDYHIIHQTGGNDIQSVQNAYAAAGIDAHVFAFRNDLDVCYSAADFIIARAGAGTLFEILFFNKKACIIPLEMVSNSHQIDNATAMAERYPNQFIFICQITLEKNPLTMLKLW